MLLYWGKTIDYTSKRLAAFTKIETTKIFQNSCFVDFFSVICFSAIIEISFETTAQ